MATTTLARTPTPVTTTTTTRRLRTTFRRMSRIRRPGYRSWVAACCWPPWVCSCCSVPTISRPSRTYRPLHRSPRPPCRQRLLNRPDGRFRACVLGQLCRQATFRCQPPAIRALADFFGESPRHPRSLCVSSRTSWGLSSAGRAPDWQSGGHRFDPDRLHHLGNAQRPPRYRGRPLAFEAPVLLSARSVRVRARLGRPSA